MLAKIIDAITSLFTGSATLNKLADLLSQIISIFKKTEIEKEKEGSDAIDAAQKAADQTGRPPA